MKVISSSESLGLTVLLSLLDILLTKLVPCLDDLRSILAAIVELLVKSHAGTTANQLSGALIVPPRTAPPNQGTADVNADQKYNICTQVVFM